jgi:hypothetical protein
MKGKLDRNNFNFLWTYGRDIVSRCFGKNPKPGSTSC